MTSCLASYAIYSSINTIYLFYFAGKNFKHFTKFYSFSHFCSARSSANSRNFLAFPSFAGASRKIISETGWKREFVFEYHASLATKILSNQFFKVEITWNGALRICRLNGDWLNAEKISEMSWKGKKNASTFVPELNAFFYWNKTTKRIVLNNTKNLPMIWITKWKIYWIRLHKSFIFIISSERRARKEKLNSKLKHFPSLDVLFI